MPDPGAVIDALIGPFADKNTWYGVMVALAFTKWVRRFVEGTLEVVRNRTMSNLGGDNNGKQKQQ